MKENINTPQFWDDQFRKEYEVLKKGEDGYVRFHPERFEMIACAILNHSKVLDFGCGLGQLCRYLKIRNFTLDVVGTDFSPYALEKANKLSEGLNIKFLNSVALGEEKFNTIIASEVIEHLDEPEEFIKKCKERLWDNGRLILTTPIKEWGGTGAVASVEHVREFSPMELKALVERYFKNVALVFPAEKKLKNGTVYGAYWFMIIASDNPITTKLINY